MNITIWNFSVGTWRTQIRSLLFLSFICSKQWIFRSARSCMPEISYLYIMYSNFYHSTLVYSVNDYCFLIEQTNDTLCEQRSWLPYLLLLVNYSFSLTSHKKAQLYTWSISMYKSPTRKMQRTRLSGIFEDAGNLLSSVWTFHIHGDNLCC